MFLFALCPSPSLLLDPSLLESIPPSPPPLSLCPSLSLALSLSLSVSVSLSLSLSVSDSLYKYISIYMYTYLYTWQRLEKIRLVTGPGGPFAARLATESGVLRQTLSATSILKTAVLYTEDSGPATKGRNRGGWAGIAINPCFERHPCIRHIYLSDPS